MPMPVGQGIPLKEDSFSPFTKGVRKDKRAIIVETQRIDDDSKSLSGNGK